MQDFLVFKLISDKTQAQLAFDQIRDAVLEEAAREGDRLFDEKLFKAKVFGEKNIQGSDDFKLIASGIFEVSCAIRELKA